MQIGTRTDAEVITDERQETAGPPPCPLCGGTLLVLHRTFRCCRCAYHLCAGCEPSETNAPGGE